MSQYRALRCCVIQSHEALATSRYVPSPLVPVFRSGGAITHSCAQLQGVMIKLLPRPVTTQSTASEKSGGGLICGMGKHGRISLFELDVHVHVLADPYLRSRSAFLNLSSCILYARTT